MGTHELAREQGELALGALDIVAPAFRARFGRAPFLVHHRLAAHRLFALPRLLELARALPARAMEEGGGWLVLKNLEREPEYAELMQRCLGQVGAIDPKRTAGLHAPEACVFISSPGAVTSYRIEAEEGFVLQMRGRQTMRICDRALVSPKELERLHHGGQRSLVHRDEYPARAQAYKLMPGLGVHVPLTAPHRVENGPEISIALRIQFRTAASARAAQVHQVNALLRRIGFEPAPVGRSPLLDGLKQLALKIRRARPLAAPFVLRVASSGDRR